MDNVTPIRAGEAGAAGGSKPPRRRRPANVRVQKLRDNTRDDDRFGTLDVINGLRGVCCALDRAAVTDGCQDIDLVSDLSMAAKVLSSLLGNRVDE